MQRVLRCSLSDACVLEVDGSSIICSDNLGLVCKSLLCTGIRCHEARHCWVGMSAEQHCPEKFLIEMMYRESEKSLETLGPESPVGFAGVVRELWVAYPRKGPRASAANAVPGQIPRLLDEAGSRAPAAD